MANTYNMVINSVDVRPTDNDLANVIYNVHWSYEGQDESGNAASIIGTQTIDEADVNDFVQFDSVTSDMVVAWISAKMDLDTLRDNIDSQIEEIVNPSSVNKYLNN